MRITTIYPKQFRLAAYVIGIIIASLLAVPTFLQASSARAATAEAKVMYEKKIDEHTYDIYVNSPLTDSWVKAVRLIVPDGWSKNASEKYPALWLLHGGMDDYKSWTNGTDIEEVAAKHKLVVVMPDTSWCSSYSDWYNDGQGGAPAWETYLTGQLRTLLNDKYAVDGSNAAIAGLSMGGLGALKLSIHHTDMFKAVASYSGNADPLHAYNNTEDGVDSPTLGCLNAPDWKKVWGDYHLPEQRLLWNRNDPYVQAEKFANLQYTYLSSGDGLSDPVKGQSTASDFLEKQVNIETRALLGKLQKLDIPVDSHLYAGTHSWPYWQEELHRSMPGLLRALNVQ